MTNLRKYGKPPFNVAVIHGGPGAPGSVAPIARELSSNWGVLEPFQTATSLEGQIQELRAVLKKNGDLPLALIGHSWGALLSFIVSARYSALIRKLILVGSGVYEAKYAKEIMNTRLSRLNEDERDEVLSLMEMLHGSSKHDKNTLMAQLGKLLSKADTYSPITLDSESLECQFNQSVWKANSVWEEFEELRTTGKLMELAEQIECPVVAIHGDYDSHPLEGIRQPLSPILKDFRIHLLRNCGHYPWIEKEARKEFFEILEEELN
ncbi:MAG: alpha/beta fold hydrolase [Candidatus Hodarchaeota archaeon]